MTRADVIGIFILGAPLALLIGVWAVIITLVMP